MDMINDSPSLLSVPKVATMLDNLWLALRPIPTDDPRWHQDAILVCIDVGIGPKGAQIGIATLDPRKLTGPWPENAVTTRLLLTRQRALPANNRTRQFLFGATEYTPPEAARKILHDILKQVDTVHGGYRNVFLVGHNIRADIQLLYDAIGLDVTTVPYTWWVSFIDTMELAGRAIQSPQGGDPSLKLTLQSFGIPARQIHNSGNDAVYTLKVLLLLFCDREEDHIRIENLGARVVNQVGTGDALWQQRINMLRGVACSYPLAKPREQVRREARLLKNGPRVRQPEWFVPDKLSAGEMGDAMGVLFGDEE